MIVKTVKTQVNELYKKLIVIESSKVIFFPIAKSASMSIKEPLIRGEFKYCTKDELYKYSGFKVVTVIRNTYERLVDCFLFFTETVPKSKKTLNLEFNTFSEFIKAISETPDDVSNCHFRSQFNTLSHDGEYLPTVTININDIQEIPDHLPTGELKVYNRTFTDASDYRSYYTQEDIELVNTRFKKDIEFFSFTF